MATANEFKQADVAFLGRGEQDALEQRDGLLRRMLAEALFPRFGRLDLPDGLHLFAAINLLHRFVVKGVARLFVARGPDDGFRGVREIAARKIRRWIWLHPPNVV